VDAAVGLVVPLDVDPGDPVTARHRMLPDGGGDDTVVRAHPARPADVDRNHSADGDVSYSRSSS